MKKYILLYSDKKIEDNICLLNMFKTNKKINVCWSDVDFNYNLKVIDEILKEDYEEIILSGFELGWDKLIDYISSYNKDIIIKVICNTIDSLLYYEYERNNFFKMLEYSKEKKINEIAFLRKGQYELYKSLGYKCCFLNENFILKDYKKVPVSKRDNINLGFFPLNYTWDKNIFNQLCVGKMLANSVITYNCLDDRMTDFLDTMNIDSNIVKIKDVTVENISNEIIKNDVIISTEFTNYFHLIFFLSMELGIPCLCGNNVDFFEDDNELKKYVVTTAEDNAIINAKMIENILANKDKILKLYSKWKEKYNVIAEKSINSFIG